MSPDPHADSRVVFFDGVCGFCNKSVDFLMRIDRSRTLRFAPLQGEYARQVLPAERVDNLDTIIFKEGDKLYYRTAALLRLLRVAGGAWRLAYPLILLPEGLRDLAYRAVARRRYSLFGKRESCRLPSPDERARFID